MISYEYKQFINDKVTQYLPGFRRIGNKLHGRCVLCGDSHKSTTKARGWYYLDTCSYYCFNCGTGMSGIKFLQLISGQDYGEIKREYVRLFLKSGQKFSLSSSFEKPNSEPGIFELKPIVKPEWKKPLSDDARLYLDRRMVLAAPFLKDRLYSCYCGNGAEYIIIPWVVNGVDAYYQLNDFKKFGNIKYIFPKDSKKLVYGLDNIDLSWKNIIVFEGVYDSLFVKNAVAVGTKSITDYQLRMIGDRYPNHSICVSFDFDRPGLDSMVKLIKRGFNGMFFKWFDSETGKKDINDYILEKNDPLMFSKPDVLDKYIMTPLQMKLWLIQNNYWT